MTAPPLADERTLEVLDFASVRDRVVASTRTQRGKARALALVPSADFTQVRIEQRRTAVVRDLAADADLHVGAAIETAELTRAAAIGHGLGAAELRAIGDALAAAAAVYGATREREELRDLLAAYVPLRELYGAISGAIDERAAVLDRASPALGRIRRSLAQAHVDARDRAAAILRSAKYASAIQDTVVTLREGRFVVPVKAEFAGEFPGIVHDTSASGQTLFIEPLDTLECNNRVRRLRIEEEREVARVLGELSRLVGENAERVEANVEMLAAIDLLAAKAAVALAMNGVEPELSDAATIRIECGRHPLLGDRAVGQTLALDDATRLLVISGPNMGGKTVALKTVGLFVVMAYCGMQLPAQAGTRVGRFSRLLADIGDEQSIAGNASTFSAHLQRMRELLDVADARTLAIVDEIGGGTEPVAGAALAVAILEHLLECGARGIVATHATELKLFAHGAPGVSNASVRFDPVTFKPTFHLDIGAPGQSLAFALARALGVDERVVARAEGSLDSRERDYEAALAELSLRNAELQSERGALAEERQAVREASDALERERARFDAQRTVFGARAEERMSQALRDFVAELARRSAESASRRPKVTASQAGLLAQAVQEMRRDLGIRVPENQGGDGGSYAPGDGVRVLSLGQDGEVVEAYGETLLIAIGPMKTVVKKADLRRRERSAAERRAVRSTAESARLAAATRSHVELDVRGKRFVDAEPLVERWIDEAVLAGSSPVRLIHGKGTGMLGRGLQEYLRGHPSVRGVRYGNENEGSTGVTIVDLA